VAAGCTAGCRGTLISVSTTRSTGGDVFSTGFQNRCSAFSSALSLTATPSPTIITSKPANAQMSQRLGPGVAMECVADMIGS
jgi:hypothetical protein